jgi:hypothetical protein
MAIMFTAENSNYQKLFLRNYRMGKMTREAASRIQSAACIAGDGTVKAGSFAARAMSAAYRNEPLSKPISDSTGIPQILVKIGIFAAAGAALYYNREAIVDYAYSSFSYRR